ncbi:MAG: hypothetical protein WC319_11615 [Candidatus Paceibacterota bacterium]|jgi:hypothetical protein
MNLFVLLFFLFIVLSTFLLGINLVRRGGKVFKSFGMALLLDGVAFILWSLGLLQPEKIAFYVTWGAIFFLASLVFLSRVSIQKIPEAKNRFLLTILSAVAAFGIFYVGMGRADAYISREGLLFFNLWPIVQMLYIFGLAVAALPAINILASKFKAPYSLLISYGFMLEVIGGIILIINTDFQVLNITGWIMAIAYLALLTILFSKKEVEV